MIKEFIENAFFSVNTFSSFLACCSRAASARQPHVQTARWRSPCRRGHTAERDSGPRGCVGKEGARGAERFTGLNGRVYCFPCLYAENLEFSLEFSNEGKDKEGV